MASPIEAQSLSSLTSLFATPPTYPRNPTHEVHDPLVLYIVRTPGSRDVFLTPLKPPTKASITLEAIQSCLYYLHVVTPEDDELRNSLKAQQRTEVTERLASILPIHRKPLPSTPFANYPASQRPATPPKSYPHYQPRLDDQQDGTQVARLAARGVHLRLNTWSGGAASGSVRRKPLGPRPVVNQRFDENTTTAQETASHLPNCQDYHGVHEAAQEQDREPWPQVEEEVPPTLPPRTNLPSPTKKAVVPEADRIVLIRRDPASGIQWNIGTLTVASSGLSATVEIDTPGYQKFAKQELDLQNFPDDGTRVLDDDTSIVAASPRGHHAANPHFLRTVDVLALKQPRTTRSGHQRTGSEDIDSPTEHNSTQPRMHPRSKCIFTSPWKGQCFFTTGLDGRSLKCRHALPVASSAGETSSETVCEIRFNLPWLRVRKRNQTQSDGDNTAQSRSVPKSVEAKAAFRKSVQRLRSGSASKILSGDDKLQADYENIKARSKPTDQEYRLDLSLGQEKAGGGFRGSSAKLGKLIIENEGLKFADLAVGACMSIWWTHYSSRGDGD